MTENSKRKEEVDKIMNEIIADFEGRAAQEQKEEQKTDFINKGNENDYQRKLQIARREVIQEQHLTREKKKSEQACWNLQCTQKLAEEVARLKNDEIREQKRRQLLRSTSDELRQLKEQLQCAYTAKTVQIQVKEREAIRRNTRCEELKQTHMMIESYKNENPEHENFIQAHEKKERYRKDLQDQLIINYRKLQKKSEDEQKEQKIVEEISQAFEKEKMEKAREKKDMTTKLRAEEEAFLKAREILKCEEKKVLLDEHNRIKRIISEKENQLDGCANKKVEKLAAKERMMEKIARKMFDEEMKKRELEDIIYTVHEEEEKISMQAKLRNQSLEKQRLARDLFEDMLRQKKATAERKARDAAVDNAFAQYIAEQNRITIKNEEEKSQDRRLRGIRYGEDLRAAIMDKKIMYAEEIRKKEALKCDDEKAEVMRRQEISEERSRILQLHAPHLQGYLRVVGVSPGNFENVASQQACQEECI